MVKNFIKEDLPAVAGGIGAKFAKNIGGKFIPNEKLAAALPLVVGILLKRGKNKMLSSVGTGMIVVGGADLAASFIPTLHGIEDMDLSGLFDGLGSSEVITNVLTDDLSDNVSDDLSDDLSEDISEDVINDDLSGSEDYMSEVE